MILIWSSQYIRKLCPKWSMKIKDNLIYCVQTSPKLGIYGWYWCIRIKYLLIKIVLVKIRFLAFENPLTKGKVDSLKESILTIGSDQLKLSVFNAMMRWRHVLKIEQTVEYIPQYLQMKSNLILAILTDWMLYYKMDPLKFSLKKYLVQKPCTFWAFQKPGTFTPWKKPGKKT